MTLTASQSLGNMVGLTQQRGEPMDFNLDCAFVEATLGRRCIIEETIAAPIPSIIDAADEFGVPLDLAMGVAFQESRFDCGARSKAGARGIMQVMPATAKWLGYDAQRLHECEYGARVGMDYLKRQLEDCLDDWVCAMEQYSCGPSCKNRNNPETLTYKVRIGKTIGVSIKGRF